MDTQTDEMSDYRAPAGYEGFLRLLKQVDTADGVEVLTLAFRAARSEAVLEYLARRNGSTTNGSAAHAERTTKLKAAAAALAPTPKRRRMSAATRAKLSAAMKARHASGLIAKAKRAAAKRRANG